MARDDVEWANPGALGLAGFGLNTVLLQRTSQRGFNRNP